MNTIFQNFGTLNKFRNRLFHHEPAWKGKSSVLHRVVELTAKRGRSDKLTFGQKFVRVIHCPQVILIRFCRGHKEIELLILLTLMIGPLHINPYQESDKSFEVHTTKRKPNDGFDHHYHPIIRGPLGF